MQSGQAFDRWMAALEARYLADLRFPEVARALRALSSTYVERRGRLARGAALDGAGKRAAFALFYGPLHYLIVRHVAESVPGLKTGPTSEGLKTGPTPPDVGRVFRPGMIVDLGCGTGAAGAACGAACDSVDLVVGIDTHPWALNEAAATYREFGLKSRTEKGDLASTRRLDASRRASKGRTLFVAAFALNELTEASRDAVMRRLCDRAEAGDAVLIVEPLAGFVAPWWPRWQREIEESGGRADQWRLAVDLPAIVAKLDHAAGLDHRELTARSLFIA
jgi:methyltransferase family protein